MYHLGPWGAVGAELPVCPRNHDRPGCGGRGFSEGRWGHGRLSRKGDGRGYRSQGPGCGRGCGAERSRRGGSGGDRGGVQSQRLLDGEGDQSRKVGQSRLPCSGDDRSRKVGRSRGLPSSGGDISCEMGRSQGLLCSGSDKGRGIGWNRLLGREPGEEGGVAALGYRNGCGGGACLGLPGGETCLALPEGPRRVFQGPRGVLKPRASSGGVAVQSREVSAERSYQSFVLGGSQVERMFIGGGPRDVVGRYAGGGESLLHIVEGDQAVPNGRHVPYVGRGSVGGGGKGPRQRGSGTQSRGAASPRTSTATNVRRWQRREVQGRTGSRRRL